MPRLSRQDMEKVAGFLQELYSETDALRLPAVMMDGLNRLIPNDVSGYNEIDSKSNSAIMVIRPEIQAVYDLAPVLVKYLPDHPQLRHYRSHPDRNVYQTTDFISQREYRQQAIYQEFYRHINGEHQMTCLLSELGDGTDIGAALNRKSKAFSERDRAVLQLLRPHLIQARKNAIAFTRALGQATTLSGALDSLNSGVVMAYADGRIQWLTARAARLLAQWFPGFGKSPAHLPETLERWFRATQAALSACGPAAPALAPFSIQYRFSSLQVRCHPCGDGALRLLLTEDAGSFADGHARALGLTLREIEVLRWIAEGKNSPEIGIILGLSPRTVHKHTERIYSKLGVESRHAATLKTRQWRAA